MSAEDIEAFEDVYNEDADADEADYEDSEVDEELEDDEELEGDEERGRELEREKIREEQSKILHIHIRSRDKRLTSDSVDIYELAGLIGLRAKQIENGD